MKAEAPISRITAKAYVIPTDGPEADGTFEWRSTTLVVVHAEAAGKAGLGYTYSDGGVASFVNRQLAPLLLTRDAFDIPAAQEILQRYVRNLGRSGLAATAISAIDSSLWDLKSRLLEVPLVKLLGAVRTHAPVYGSGGFTNYEDSRLAAQLGGWVEREGCRWVKMKVGRDLQRDRARVRVALQAIGNARLFVDANGALSRKAALGFAAFCAEQGVGWFEEPVSSDDLDGLRLLRDRAPGHLEIAAGEYAYNLDDIRRTLQAQAVDVQQADATRCLGISGFMAAGPMCEAHHTDLSAHCAPSLHLHAACALPRLRHVEYFYDHVRIEQMLFDGAAQAKDGLICPDLTCPGLGLEVKEADAQRYEAGSN
jgi:L-alanine-DL-glutamate epimerase-like enolase superfamily enzyme